MRLTCVKCKKTSTKDDLDTVLYSEDEVYFVCSERCSGKYRVRSGQDRRTRLERRLSDDFRFPRYLAKRRSNKDRRIGADRREFVLPERDRVHT
jgi:hypothetical protein